MAKSNALRKLIEANPSMEGDALLKLAASKKIPATKQAVSRIRNTMARKEAQAERLTADPDTLRRETVKSTIASLLVSIGQLLEQL